MQGRTKRRCCGENTAAGIEDKRRVRHLGAAQARATARHRLASRGAATCKLRVSTALLRVSAPADFKHAARVWLKVVDQVCLPVDHGHFPAGVYLDLERARLVPHKTPGGKHPQETESGQQRNQAKEFKCLSSFWPLVRRKSRSAAGSARLCTVPAEKRPFKRWARLPMEQQTGMERVQRSHGTVNGCVGSPFRTQARTSSTQVNWKPLQVFCQSEDRPSRVESPPRASSLGGHTTPPVYSAAHRSAAVLYFIASAMYLHSPPPLETTKSLTHVVLLPSWRHHGLSPSWVLWQFARHSQPPSASSHQSPVPLYLV